MKPPTHSSEVLSWAKQQPWFKELCATPQDPVFHAEGNVGIHTEMVYAEVMKLSLSESDKYLLALAAVFHDISKPACTQIEGTRVTSPGHGRKGAQRMILETYEWLSPQIRNTLYHLIRLHGRPMYALEGPTEAMLALWSQDLSLHILFEFVKCDLRGRICPDLPSQLLSIDLLSSEAQRLGCLSSPFVFASPELKIQLNSRNLTDLSYTPFFQPKSQVYVLHGLPGSGKDTYCKNSLPNIPMISLDGLRQEVKDGEFDKNQIYSEAKERCKLLLAEQKDFIFNATNLSRSLRLKWLNLFYQYGAQINGIYIEPAFATLLKQNNSRQAVVPRKAIEEMYGILEYPISGDYHTLKLLLKQ
jgi:predicted kinase